MPPSLVCAISRLVEMQHWLLDADACKTEWQELIDIRARHA